MAFTAEGWQKAVEKAKQHLQPGEAAIEWTNGLCESTMLGRDTKRNGIILATNRRVVIFISKLLGGYELEEFPYSTMSSIEMSKGILGYTAKFVASSNTTTITMMSQGNPQGLIDFVRSRIGTKEEKPTATPLEDWNCRKCGALNKGEWKFCGACGSSPEQQPQAPTADNDGLLEKLERLAELHTKGLLTQEEFQEAKAKLLQ